ncbi:MAG: hypothetical protein A2Y77_16750 [Planctomycetes bacterium RBG_13_62_9]|nr:MAG: hypothetical protein A2Y77_16750 [Planctomycetes bacterium RBG_13_62_9]
MVDEIKKSGHEREQAERTRRILAALKDFQNRNARPTGKRQDTAQGLLFATPQEKLKARSC